MQGKPTLGAVKIEVSRDGEDIEVRVLDDLAGIDVETVLESAVAKGVISEKQASGMVDPEIRQLIFEQGFSAAGTMSDTSGRGVGMSAVRDVVESLGGSVVVDQSAELTRP
ncbi:MAG: hypothetical protein GY811_03795 [Myxococcales bacterium]|nr:hypothetical protein [Myxococcales bacterium]